MLGRLRDKAGNAGVVAAGVLLLLTVTAFSLPFLPLDAETPRLPARLASPAEMMDHGLAYVFGADELGRPLLVRVLLGARVSLAVGVLVSVLAMVIGVTVGIAAGLYRGLVEDVTMRIIDVWMSVPPLLIALVVLYVTGPGVGRVILVLALMRWVVFARVVRALTLSLREQQFFEAARVVGCSTPRIVRRHLLPNMKWDILVVANLEIARAMLAEAALSFLGLGVQPPQASWGTILATGRGYLYAAPWIVLLPGLAILTTTISINVLTHGLRSRLPLRGQVAAGAKTNRSG